MNAISDTQPDTAADRTARHLHHCRELAELGMDLARISAARARLAHETLAHQTQATEAMAQEMLAPIPCRLTDPYAEQLGATAINDCALLFTRLSRCVRQTMALENRIAADHAAATRPPADPRRAKIRRAIREATEDHPHRAEIRRRADDQLETELALDPEARATLPDLLSTLCEDLGFHLDYESLAEQLAPEYFAWSMGNGTPPH